MNRKILIIMFVMVLFIAGGVSAEIKITPTSSESNSITIQEKMIYYKDEGGASHFFSVSEFNSYKKANKLGDDVKGTELSSQAYSEIKEITDSSGNTGFSSVEYKDGNIVLNRNDGLEFQVASDTGESDVNYKGQVFPGDYTDWKVNTKTDTITYDGSTVEKIEDGKISLAGGTTLQWTSAGTEVKTTKAGKVFVSFENGATASMTQSEFEKIGSENIDKYQSNFEKGKTAVFEGFAENDVPVFRVGSKYYIGTELTDKKDISYTSKFEDIKGYSVEIIYDPKTREEVSYKIDGNNIDVETYNDIKGYSGNVAVSTDDAGNTIISLVDKKSGNKVREISVSKDYSIAVDEEGEKSVSGMKSINDLVYYNIEGENVEFLKRNIVTVDGQIMQKTDYDIFYDEDNKKIIAEGYQYTYDEKSKKLEYSTFVYKESGLSDTYSYKDGQWYQNDNAISESAVPSNVKKSRTAANIRKHISTFESAARVFSGLGFYTSLFMSDEEMRDWRDAVDDLFCSTILLGDIECWSSEICSNYYDKSAEGIAYVETPSGMIEAAAHIEAEKSTPIFNPETQETEYLYKITFYVKASEENVKFNVKLYGDATTELFSKDIFLEGDEEYAEEETEISEGSEYSALKENAIVQYSSNNYDKVCIEFSEGDIDDLCNKIAESDYSKDNVVASGESGTSSGESSSDGSAAVMQI